MKFTLVLLSLVALVDASRLKRSSALRVKPAGQTLEDLALSADEPADKKKDDAVKESADATVKTEAPPEKKEKDAKPSPATEKAPEKTEKPAPKEDEAATKEPEKKEKEPEKPVKEAPKEEKAAPKEPEKKEAPKEEKAAPKVDKETAEVKKETPKAEKATAEQKNATSKEVTTTEAPATTSTTLSVFDAPNVKKASTTLDPVSNETLSNYMRDCARQLKAIVKKAEAHYTHEQLVIALRQECDLDKEFPTVRNVFFDHRRDCREFAEKLGAAREAELKGDANAYAECCQAAWEEKSQAMGIPLVSALVALVVAHLM